MTVKELIERLSELDQDLEVRTEGCDCDGEIGSVSLQTTMKFWDDQKITSFVYLERPGRG